jgi:hypothetical protein
MFLKEDIDSIYLWLYRPLLDLDSFFSFLVSTQSARLLGRGSARRKAATCTQDNKNRINAHRHPCLKWDPNSRSQCLSGRRQFIPKTARPPRSADIDSIDVFIQYLPHN